MESFLVRIYRHNEGDPQKITGRIEEILTSRRVTFRNLAELESFFPAPQKSQEAQVENNPPKVSNDGKVEDAQ